MTKKKGVYVQMNDREMEQYGKAKGSRTHREILLSGAGLAVEERSRGRPTAEDLVKRANEKWRADVGREVRDRMIAATRDFSADEATKVTCPRCGTKWTTQLDGPRMFPCHVCGYQITIRGPETKARPVLQAVVPDAATDALRRTNTDRRRRTEDEQRTAKYSKVDAEYDAVMKKMRGGSFKFDTQTLSQKAAIHFIFTDKEWDNLPEETKNIYVKRFIELTEGE